MSASTAPAVSRTVAETGRPKPGVVVQRIEYNPGQLIPTGIKEIDAIIGGIGTGECTVVTSPTGIGKSSLGVRIARNLQTAGYSCLYVVGEMRPDNFLEKMVATDMQAEWREIRYGLLTGSREEERARLWDWYHENVLHSLHFADRKKYKQINAARVARWARSGRYKIIIVDYLTTILDGGRGDEKEKIDAAMSILERAAEETGVAIVIMAQLNREVEGAKVPELKWIQGSSKIEQKAWTVVMLMKAYEAREEEVGKTKRGEPIIKTVMHEVPGVVALWCLKHRVDGWARVGKHIRVPYWRGHYGAAQVNAAKAAEAQRVRSTQAQSDSFRQTRT